MPVYYLIPSVGCIRIHPEPPTPLQAATTAENGERKGIQEPPKDVIPGCLCRVAPTKFLYQVGILPKPDGHVVQMENVIYA